MFPQEVLVEKDFFAMPLAIHFTLVSNLSIKSNFKACKLVLQKEVTPEDLLGQCSEHLRNHNIADPSSCLQRILDWKDS